jgi:hypothetical protein
VDPGEKGAILEAGRPGPPGEGKGGQLASVGFRQWRRIDVASWLKTQETGSPHLQETVMHRVSVIVHCVAVIHYNHNRNHVFCIICFRKINHLVPITICIHPLMYRKLCRAQV